MKIIASVDHLEGDRAILMMEGIRIELPLRFLPQGIQAGSWVDLTITQNHEKEAQVREHVKNLLDELKEGKHLDGAE